MVKRLALSLFLISCTASPSPSPEVEQPEVVSVGHGSFIGSNGEILSLNEALILANQDRFITTLQQLPGTESFSKIQAEIDALVSDDVLAGALAIDWLLLNSEPDNRASITTLNNAMRWEYVQNLQKEPILPEDDVWSKGVDKETAAALEDLGLTVTYSIKSGGSQYIEDCRAAGVPVPDTMWSDEWKYLGTLENSFASSTTEGDIWQYVSQSGPRGVCLALPRYPLLGGDLVSDETELLGIICLGQDTNKACFFDNPQGTSFTREVEVSIESFVGGFDLVANSQGTCSDCHAGENPYIIHPDDAPFIGLSPSIGTTGWHEPLVDASWPQNPGPTNLLDAVSSTQRCDGCHTSGGAGRFPELSNELLGYCATVLNAGALAVTMPPYGEPSDNYAVHMQALSDACESPPSIGTEVDFDVPDDGAFISPVQIIDPLYACSTKVAVRGAILDAEVDLLVNGVVEDTQIARSPSLIEFDVPELAAGDLVTAVQTVEGTSSALSTVVEVRDHAVDYPDGLPAPDINPTLLYECGEVLAVRHVPGAKLTVYSNGADPVTRSTSTGWSSMYPSLRPFEIGDAFSASISLCGDSSPTSAEAYAVAAPDTLPAPTFSPAELYVGQELLTIETITHGAQVTIDEASLGPVGEITSPVSWYPDYDIAAAMGRPLEEGDQLLSQQILCEISPATKTDKPAPCSELPAPRIRHPMVDDTFVVLTESVPGARVRVYDANGAELGDGSGTVIQLSRAVTGTDNLTIAQSVGTCTSESAFQVYVRSTGKDDKE